MVVRQSASASPIANSWLADPGARPMRSGYVEKVRGLCSTGGPYLKRSLRHGSGARPRQADVLETMRDTNPAFYAPDMGQLSEASWWWDTAFEGIAGSVVAGLITVGALWWTIRHERNRSRHDALVVDVRAFIAATRQRTAWLRDGDDRFMAEYNDWMADLGFIVGRMSAKDHTLVALIQALSSKATNDAGGYIANMQDGTREMFVGDPRGWRNAAGSVVHYLTWWMIDPTTYRKWTDKQLQDAVAPHQCVNPER